MAAPGVALAADPATIEGEVTAADGGAQLEGVWVCAYLIDESEYEELCDETGSDGRYALVLAPGEYGVEFWSGFESPFLAQFYDGVERWSEADPIPVVAGQTVADIDAELVLGGTISGTVGLAGGGPLREVWVCAEAVLGGRYACGETDSAGEYELVGLSSGEYVVEFWPAWSPRPDLALQFYDGAESRADADPVALLSGEEVTEIDAALTLGGRIEGTVRAAASGAPLPWRLACAIDSLGELIGCAETNSVGRYSIQGLASDDYRVGFSLDFAEWYGEEPSPEEDDGYLPQFYDGSPTLAGSASLALLAPAVLTGIDASLISSRAPVSPALVPAPVPPLPSTLPIASKPTAKKKHKHCRPGFKAKKIKGKQRCVRKHRHKRRGKKRGNATRLLLAGPGRVRIQP